MYKKQVLLLMKDTFKNCLIFEITYAAKLASLKMQHAMQSQFVYTLIVMMSDRLSLLLIYDGIGTQTSVCLLGI